MSNEKSPGPPHDKKTEMEQLWQRFIENCTKNTWTEKEIIADRKVTRNFHGSVDAYKKVFMKTVGEFFSD
jgi:hypothetical protein